MTDGFPPPGYRVFTLPEHRVCDAQYVARVPGGGIAVIQLAVHDYTEALTLQRLMAHVQMTREEDDMEGTHEGEATTEPRVGIDVPADGSVHTLPAPECDGSPACRAMEHVEGCVSVAAWEARQDESDTVELSVGRDHDVIGAIRMARVGAADPASSLRIIDRLLTYADETHPRAIAPTRLLLDAIAEEQGTFSVPQL